MTNDAVYCMGVHHPLSLIPSPALAEPGNEAVGSH